MNRKPIILIVALWLGLSLIGYWLYRGVAAGGVAFGRISTWLAPVSLTRNGDDSVPLLGNGSTATTGSNLMVDAGGAPSNSPSRVASATRGQDNGDDDEAARTREPPAAVAARAGAPAMDASDVSTRAPGPVDAGESVVIVDAAAPARRGERAGSPDATSTAPAPGWGSTGVTAGEAGATGITGGPGSTGVGAGAWGSTGLSAGEAGSTGITGGAAGSTGITGSRAP